MKKTGSFNLAGKILSVSDPGYNKDIWCSGKLDALPGVWNVFIKTEVEKYKYQKENFEAYITALNEMDEKAKEVKENIATLTSSEIDDAIQVLCKFPKYEDYLVLVDAERFRTTELIVIHDSLNEDSYSLIKEKTDINALVDSGQCGFYDYEKYPLVPDDRCFDEGPNYKDFDDTWYGQLCNQNTEENGFVFDFGAISHTGWGDGGYNVYVLKNSDNVVVGAKIVYIGDEEDTEND